jgi:hypothetical protein
MRRRYQKRHPVTGLIVGAISGLAATVVMTQFQNVWNKVSEEMHKPKAPLFVAPQETEHPRDRGHLQGGQIRARR